MDVNDKSKQYSLRWEKHAFNLASEAGCFFEDESFLDCTLSAEGQCIDAHKIILSASSSYLSSLLKIMPDKHPILIFNDIKFEQLKLLVAFIYNGSVNISENNIHAFLNAAQSLLIKGLSEESRGVEEFGENAKRFPKSMEVQDRKGINKKNIIKPSLVRKPDILGMGKNFKKQRQSISKSDGPPFVECEESLSKLQEISFTKYIHQNLNSKPHAKNENTENRWNGPSDEKLRPSENYIVRSWKHNSVEDLNGRHKQNKNNSIKKIKLEKQVIVCREEEKEKNKVFLEQSELSIVTGNHSDRIKLEAADEKVKKETYSEQIMLVEPKKEVTEDNNSGEFDHSTNNETDSDSVYDGRSGSNYYQQPVVDRGIPVPLLMCRTSLSEPDTIEPNWMPQITGTLHPENSSQINLIDNNAQDLQCRKCTQDLPCPTCTKKYKSRYALNRHILYECGKARKSFSCDECGKKVTRQDTLQKHKLIHLVQHLKKKESEGSDESSNSKKLC